MLKGWAVVLAMAMLALPTVTRAQTGEDAADKNAKQARAALDAMVKALGGDAWLNMKNTVREGHIAAFYRGQPDLGTMKFYEYHEWPDRDRTEFTTHRDVMQFYIGRKGTEVTYKGAKALPQDQVDDFLRRRDHSIETAVKTWLKDPKTILVYEGQRMSERHRTSRSRSRWTPKPIFRCGAATNTAILSTMTSIQTWKIMPITTPLTGSPPRSQSHAQRTTRWCERSTSTRSVTTRTSRGIFGM